MFMRLLPEKKHVRLQQQLKVVDTYQCYGINEDVEPLKARKRGIWVNLQTYKKIKVI